MAPTPPPLPQGVPQWAGTLLVGVSVIVITNAMHSIGTKLDQNTAQIAAANLQAAETRKVVEMLCDLWEKKEGLDKEQNERLRQIELRVFGASR